MRTVWENVTRSRPAKVVWWLILAGALFFGALMVGAILVAAQMGCYQEDATSYLDTDSARWQGKMLAEDILSEYLIGGGSQAMEANYGADQTNARFRITAQRASGNGCLLYDNGYEDDVADREVRDIVRIYFQVYPDTLNYSLLSIEVAEQSDHTDDFATNQSGSTAFSPVMELEDQAIEQADREDQTQADESTIPWDVLIGEAQGGMAEFLQALREVEAGDTPVQQEYTGTLTLALLDPLEVPARTDSLSYAEQQLLKDNARFTAFHAGRNWYGVGAAVCLVAGIAAVTALLCGAGRRVGKGDAVVLCWFDHIIPMELSLAALLISGFLAIWIGGYVAQDCYSLLMRSLSDPVQPIWGTMVLIALGITIILLLAFGWLMAFARSAKTGHAFRGFWSIRFAAWVFGALRRMTIVPAAATVVAGFVLYNLWFCWLMTSYQLYGLGFLVAALLFLILILLWIAVPVAVLYLALGVRALQKQTERIAAGDYTPRPAPHWMLPQLCRQANTLDHIAAGMNAAVEQRMKSERLKTELITNVSHDLKTPLTSIINYTDLLQREALPPQAAEYAAVLARQGERLKKLTEDLIEASKASSGAMACNPVPTDLGELCEQAVGEYSEKFAAASLTPVLDLPEGGLHAMADGRLTWRVLDNLLNNACKYALPGTRLYLSGTVENNMAVLLVKNISRDPLNISADALMERFVRGDSARSSEGSGLGLSIAQSLTELQGGRFVLDIDGDLFKATIRLPLLTVPPRPAEPAQDAGAGGPVQTPAPENP